MTDTITPRKAFRLEPIVVVATSNPKKKGSMSFDRFASYFKLDGSKENTVQDAVDAGVRMDDIRHDQAHGSIVIGEKAIAAHLAAEAKAKVEAIAAAKKLIAEAAKA